MATAGTTSVGGRVEMRDVNGDAGGGGRSAMGDMAGVRSGRQGGLAAIGIAQVFSGVAAVLGCGTQIDTSLEGFAPIEHVWFYALLACAALAGVGQIPAGVVLLMRRRSGPLVVSRAQRLAVASVVPLFLVGAGSAVWHARGGWVMGHGVGAIIMGAVRLGPSVAAAVFAMLAVAVLRILRRAGRADETGPGAGEGAVRGDEILSDETLSYATGARREHPARERLRALGLDAIGLTEAVFGLALLGWCGLSMDKVAYAGFGFNAFVVCAAAAGVCQAGAGALLLARRWGRARVVRRTQQLAAGSLGPLVLFGVGMTIWAGIAAYRGTDMFAGLAVAMGIGLTIVTSFVAALALAAVRMLRRDGDLSDCVPPAPVV